VAVEHGHRHSGLLDDVNQRLRDARGAVGVGHGSALCRLKLGGKASSPVDAIERVVVARDDEAAIRIKIGGAIGHTRGQGRIDA